MASFDDKVRDFCLKLYDIGVLKFGDFRMKVGLNSPVYIDLRITVSHPRVLAMLSDLMTEFIVAENVKPSLFCGVPYTALPIATLVAVKADVPMVVRRKERKGYGTNKLIEGIFKAGDECVIIEDIVTSGSSILETVNDLKNDGLIVKHAFVVVDREQGGVTNLENSGIKMHSLLNFSKVLEILHANRRIEAAAVEKVKVYLQNNQISPTGDPLSSLGSRLKLSYGKRADVAKCLLGRQLLLLMEDKKTNLCCAIDVQKKSELLELVELVGPHAAVIKTHYDAVLDWDHDTETSLQELSKKHNFLIMEDRKFSDIGRTVRLQCDKVFPWASLVTLHSLSGSGVLTGAVEAASNYPPRAVFLLAQMSSKGNLISHQYTKDTVTMGREQAGFVAGYVCRTPDIISDPGLIQLMPGVSSSKGGDNLGQSYVGVEEAIIEFGGDLIVVGRDITQHSDPATRAAETKNALWQAYLKRIQ